MDQDWDWDMKIQMHETFCDKETDTKFTRQPRKAVMPQEAERITAESREFY